MLEIIVKRAMKAANCNRYINYFQWKIKCGKSLAFFEAEIDMKIFGS